MSVQRLRITLTDGEDGWIVAECPSLPGCISQGRTIREALDNIKDAITGWLEVAERRSPERIEIEPVIVRAVVH